jgi:hypothetical protein
VLVPRSAKLESYSALCIALAIFLPIAVRLLALRDAARTEPDALCTTLSTRQLRLLRACSTRPVSTNPSNWEVYMALAALGGTSTQQWSARLDCARSRIREAARSRTRMARCTPKIRSIMSPTVCDSLDALRCRLIRKGA